MPDHIARPKPAQNQFAADLAALSRLIAAGIEVDGEVQVAESTWFLYGHAGYDGAIVVGEYHDAAEASAVLRAAPRPGRRPGRAPGAEHEGPTP